MNSYVTSSSPTPAAPPASLGRRRRSVRVCLAVLAVCVLVIGLAIPLTLAHRAQQVLTRVRNAGAAVQIVPPRARSGSWLHRTWTQLKRKLPESYRCLDSEHELHVRFERSSTIDDQWLVDHNFASLRCRLVLYIYHPEVTDVGISALANIRQLETLSVSRTRVTDKGLTAFAGHEQLSGLGLQMTNVTAACLPLIATLPELRDVSVFGTEITGEELRQLRSCPKLEALVVDPDQLTEPLLSDLHHFPALNMINILPAKMSLPGWSVRQPTSGCDDALLARVLKEPKIERLFIQHAGGITDASLPSLLAATHLSRLMIFDAGMSLEAAVKVNKAHPQGRHPAVQLASESTGH